METAITHNIKISVESFYLDDRSNPEDNLFVFAYRIRMNNLGYRQVQLISRHWIITDSTGEIREVRGDGVVGEQPLINPGESYEYMSGSQLESEFGTMQGTYRMRSSDGVIFDVEIPCFTLAVPGVLN
ncbi:MAG: Co2+/Mg2+ efflux protein ApaG [SAR324 cluster bacterium]|nr:Co2+/Mg2+ efflux protein ApaG [SAR324 cluster bacterium]